MSSYGSLRESSVILSSDIQAIATYILETNALKYFTHHFVGVEFFSDSIGTPVIPSGGTYVITVETRELPDIYQDVQNNSIDASDVASVNFSGNPVSIQFVPDTITDATHFRINISSNRT